MRVLNAKPVRKSDCCVRNRTNQFRAIPSTYIDGFMVVIVIMLYGEKQHSKWNFSRLDLARYVIVCCDNSIVHITYTTVFYGDFQLDESTSYPIRLTKSYVFTLRRRVQPLHIVSIKLLRMRDINYLETKTHRKNTRDNRDDKTLKITIAIRKSLRTTGFYNSGFLRVSRFRKKHFKISFRSARSLRKITFLIILYEIIYLLL